MKKTGPLQIDLETLLSPISAERPSGESLRYEGTYDRIEEERKEDNPNLPQGVWETSLKTANWEAVREISIEALETRSKDLPLAAWLLEAWLHLHGFSGVREGLKRLKGLCFGWKIQRATIRRFWSPPNPKARSHWPNLTGR